MADDKVRAARPPTPAPRRAGRAASKGSVPCALLALAALLALSGCVRVGPGDDVYLVCERKRGAPGAAYGPEDLLRLTRWDNATLAREDAAALVAAAQPHVITLGGAPHQTFAANLTSEGDGLWRFVAQATTREGVEDRYDVLLQESPAPSAVATTITPPASVVAAAEDVLAREPDLADLRARTPALVGAAWDPESPSCVRLDYAERVGEEGARSVVHANLAQERVVQAQRIGWG